MSAAGLAKKNELTKAQLNLADLPDPTEGNLPGTNITAPTYTAPGMPSNWGASFKPPTFTEPPLSGPNSKSSKPRAL
jgi:hypothetical protein